MLVKTSDKYTGQKWISNEIYVALSQYDRIESMLMKQTKIECIC